MSAFARSRRSVVRWMILTYDCMRFVYAMSLTTLMSGLPYFSSFDD
jgi:hypothetical protein